MNVDDIIEQTAGLNRADLESVVPIITVMARAYTRGNGFDNGEPNEELAAVITTAASRLAANPSGISHAETAGVYSRDLRGAFGGWTLAEQFVLNRYRVRAQ
ncbi:hypothetical protein [Mycolicibacter arupensis]|jgi:hypothetical protein|uniref:Uncharacterized protein n=1 Tax=Mycolicibacter arupensis TaxID=342002 RepID=A0A5C7XL28_9MYCO|nr:hypothetical protein [Mycolicibacter arupensis]TXI50189.1 MAG: hypothetical protein E6Q54_21715 [Mycolicibacter arupensis]